jgi:hypothetical protein
MPKKKLFRVGRSHTGLGLFAIAPIKKRARIVQYQGRLLTTAQADPIERNGNRYLYEINSRWTIDGTSRRNIARYANHSCNPNAETVTLKGRRVFIRALRDIKPGEEITYELPMRALPPAAGAQTAGTEPSAIAPAKAARPRRQAPLGSSAAGRASIAARPRTKMGQQPTAGPGMGGRP